MALCLTCSSSPSPKVTPFFTPCCTRPICERCLTRNPRLRGYNPCLACLVGVEAVSQRVRLEYTIVPGPSGQSRKQEEGMFILGDDEEEDDDVATLDVKSQDAPPPYPGIIGAGGEVTACSKYIIKPGDTLRGIALKYGVDGHKLCQLNSLPYSTLNTTPHLMHTRRWLTLPPTIRHVSPAPDIQDDKRERAEKRFQFVTKEVDWRIAKAYVALAEDDDDEDDCKTDAQPVLEAKAVGRYLDDEEWESRQSGGPCIQGFPPFA